MTGCSKLFGFKSMIPSKTPRNKKYYCMYPIYLKPGTIGTIDGFDYFENKKCIVKSIIKKKVNSIIPDTGDFSQNFGYVHFVYDTREEFYKIIQLIHDTITIKDSLGNNMIIEHDKSFFENIRVE